MIGPPGLPKVGRRVFHFAGSAGRLPLRLWPLKLAAALYFAGVLAHFGHHMAVDLPAGARLHEALARAPLCLVWPADLIGTLIART
jgi:hypothetical protein